VYIASALDTQYNIHNIIQSQGWIHARFIVDLALALDLVLMYEEFCDKFTADATRCNRWNSTYVSFTHSETIAEDWNSFYVLARIQGHFKGRRNFINSINRLVAQYTSGYNKLLTYQYQKRFLPLDRSQVGYRFRRAIAASCPRLKLREINSVPALRSGLWKLDADTSRYESIPGVCPGRLWGDGSPQTMGRAHAVRKLGLERASNNSNTMRDASRGFRFRNSRLLRKAEALNGRSI